MNINDLKGLRVYAVERSEVEQMEFSGIKQLIKVLEKRKKKSFGSLMITFSGYDNTSDEVFEVPEVRKWVKELFSFCPHLLYFISFPMETHKWLIPCICYEVNTAMPEGARKTENEWFEEGKFIVDDRPRMYIQQRMDKETLNRLITGLKMFGAEANDQAGAAEIIHFLKWNFDKEG